MSDRNQLKGSHYRPVEFGWLVCVSLLGIAFFSYSLPSLLFYFGVPIKEYYFPAAVLCGIILTECIGAERKERGSTGWIVVTLIIVLLSLLLAGFVYDVSYDGMRYHQEIVATLCNGWNPLDSSTDKLMPRSIWSVHYAKGVEIMAAVITSFTGQIEMGKGVGLMLLTGAAFGVYSFLRECPGRIFIEGYDDREDKKWSRRKSLWFTIGIVFNPVVGSQLFTYYIDFYKYLYLLYVMLGFYSLTLPDRVSQSRGIVILLFSLVLAMVTKFNFFFEGGVWMVLACIFALFKKDFRVFKRMAWASVGALGCGVVLCCHPYITNWIAHGHPLYPLMGECSIDIMTGNTPAEYMEHNRIFNFFRSLVSVSMPYVTQRFGGFTIFMPLILVISIVIGLMMRKRLRAWVWYAAAVVLLSCFIFEQSWWARYICQLWLFGGLYLIASQLGGRMCRKLGVMLSVLMALGGGMALARGLYIGISDGYYMRSLLEVAKEDRIKIYGLCEPQSAMHLNEHRIRYISVDTIMPAEKERGFYYFSSTHPLLILSEVQVKELQDRMSSIGRDAGFFRYSVRSEKEARGYEEDFQ